MRIAVLGAGAVGGTLAALLARAGHDVEVTARGENLEAIRRGGIRLEGGFGSYLAKVQSSSQIGTVPHIAILATKAQDAAAALDTSAAAIAGVPVLVVQNGLGGLAVAAEHAPSSPVLSGLALFAASYVGPGHVLVTGENPLVIGAPEATPREVLDRVAGVLGGALPVEVTRDIRGAQWTKLLINHVNALPAITGLSVQEVVADDGLREVLTASMRESVGVARATGVRFGSMQGVPGRALELIGVLPLWAGAAFPRLLARRMGSVPNPGSTLQSIRRGQLTEIDFLNGAVVDAARAGGVAAPVNTAIVEMVHEVERTATFLPRDEVIARCQT
ncbi:MAG: 2-dehydropantoate 2-reductase [Pseudolysinimonas sp.]